MAWTLLVASVVGGIMWVMLEAEVASKSYAKISDFMIGVQQDPPPTINARTKLILADLRLCESGGKDSAVNEMDLDGTPSWGRYQFKPETLRYFAMRYGILDDVEPHEIYNLLMDGDFQEVVLVSMIEEYGLEPAFWLQQFPACSRKYEFWKY